MKIYKKIVFDKDDNIIEEVSYDYPGPAAECKGGGGGGGGGFFGKIFKVFSDVLGSIVKIFTSPFGLDMSVPDVAASSDQQIQGVLLNKDSGITNIPVVYGTRLVGGARVFVATKSADNQYLYVAYALSEGQCNGYTQLLVDDIAVTPASYAHGVSTAVSTAPYSAENRLQVQFFDGRDDQVASTLLKEAPGWTDNHTLSGICYLACRFRWKKVVDQADADNNPYGGGIPNIKVTVQGKKIFDLVTGYTRTEYGSFNDSTDEGYTLTSEDTYAYKSLPVSVTNGYFFEDNNTNRVDFIPARNDAEVKVTLRAVLNSNSNRYGQYNLGFKLFKDGVNYRPGDVPIGETGATAITLSNGTVSVSIEKTIPNLVTTSTWRFEPFISIATAGSGGGVLHVVFNQNTISGSAEFTLETKTPEVENHTVEYANETVVYSNNPVNVLLDYMRNPRYGKGLTNDAFDWVSFRRAALMCNQTVAYTDTTTGKAFTCDAVMETSASIMNNCKILLVGFRGIMPYTQGRFQLRIENAGDDTDIEAVPSSPAVAFTATADNIIGGLSLIGDNKETKINRCRITYVDPLADYQPNEVIWPDEGSADDTAYLAEDNDQRFESVMSLSTVANREQALQYAEVSVKRSRNAKQIQFATTIAGSNVSVGDLCRVISPGIGLDGVFRITDIRLNSEGDIQITGFEHQPTNYVINAKPDDIARPTLSLPDPYLTPPPTSLVLQTGATYNILTNTDGYSSSDATVKRLRASWTATADPFFARYLVQYKLSADANFLALGSTTETEFYISPISTGVNYDVRVASVNELGRQSAWITVSNHTAIA